MYNGCAGGVVVIDEDRLCSISNFNCFVYFRTNTIVKVLKKITSFYGNNRVDWNL